VRDRVREALPARDDDGAELVEPGWAEAGWRTGRRTGQSPRSGRGRIVAALAIPARHAAVRAPRPASNARVAWSTTEISAAVACCE
jgi:hypothetical protein